MRNASKRGNYIFSTVIVVTDIDKTISNIVDERISTSTLRKKNIKDEHIMKNRSKIYYVSHLEVNIETLMGISDDIKNKTLGMTEVIRRSTRQKN